MTIFIFLPGVFFLQVSQSVFTLTLGVKICLQSFRVPLFLPAVKGFAFSVPRSSLLTSSHSSLSPLLPGGILLLPNLFPLELLILNRTLSLFALIEDFPFSADSFCSALSWHWIILLPNSDHKKLFFTATASKVEASSWRRTGGAARRWEGAGEAAVPAWDRGKQQPLSPLYLSGQVWGLLSGVPCTGCGDTSQGVEQLSASPTCSFSFFFSTSVFPLLCFLLLRLSPGLV